MLRRAAPTFLRRFRSHGVIQRLSTEVDDLDKEPFRYIKVSQEDRVGLISLHRPKERNALNEQMATELVTAVEQMDQDGTVHAMVIAGGERAFAAGADVPELVALSARSARKRNEGAWIDKIAAVQKPVIAAVSGYALGVGCELAMAADIIIADRDAKFGLPEVALGTHPGHGGTQRLVRAVGKTKAMEMILTGRHMIAEEAESSGLVSRLAEKGKSRDEALDVAHVIAKHSLPVLMAAKECVNTADEMSLSEGVRFERRSYQATFGLDDQKEGMQAFIEQRKPSFKNK